MKRAAGGILAAGLAVALTACGGGGAATPSPAPSPYLGLALEDTAYADAVLATNTLGLDLLLGQEAGENAIVSPASLTIALAMLAVGATADGEAELDSLLGLAGTARTEAYSALTTALGGYQDGEFSLEEVPGNPYLRVANNLVAQEGFEISETFSTALFDAFGAPMGSADFSAPSGKETLDEWVRENTAGLIEESAIVPTPDLRLVLQNALLFAAKWATVFDPNTTGPWDFTRADGSTVSAEMMAQLMQVRYGESGGYQAIELPYSSDFTAFFVLPTEGEEPTPEGLRAAIDAIGAERLVDIVIPTFDLAAKTDVREYLEGAGISAIFDDAESLRGISDADLVVDQIAQQARLIVDEDGTVGAAVTEIGARETAAPMAEAEFHADRPFLMVVRHDTTGIDVFTAYINDPTADS